MAGMGSIERVASDLAVDCGMAAAVAVVYQKTETESNGKDQNTS